MFKKIVNEVSCALGRLLKPGQSNKVVIARSLVSEILGSGRWLAMMYIGILDFKLAEQIYGRINCNQVLQNMNQLIRTNASEYLKPYGFVDSILWGDDIIVFFSSPEEPPPSALELAGLADRSCNNLSATVNEVCRHLIPSPLSLQCGYSLLHPQAGNIDNIFYEGFKEAMLVAGNNLGAEEMVRREQFGRILKDKAISVVYQPVVSLENGKITGYEALARGPENSFFNKPVNLFGYAEKTNQLFALEKLARAKALSGFGDNYRDKKIFINISPQVVNDPSFRADELIACLAETGASPQQVVFEITERTSINDFCSFRDSLGYYRQYGFQVAVDDAGSGFSSLQAISELQPDFIKLDMSLIRDIDKTPNKRSLVETFITFSEKTGSTIIAEGIETAGELDCLRELGVHLGQGFFLARPDNPCPQLYPQAINKLSCAYHPAGQRDRFGRMIPVGAISQSSAAVTLSTRTSEMMDFFTRYPQVEGVAIVEDQRPMGLVMRDKLFNQLATQFGFAIYNERPISLVMDNQPLIVENDTPVELVSQTALGRPNNKVYDSVIVVKNGIYLGLVSFRSLLDTITSMQIKAARFANPLTGLPGNRQIEEELINRLNSDQPFSIIYSDLDHFKSFNDCYGFERGDLVIQLAADIMKEVTAGLGKEDDMVGHIGGDDYIIITRPDVAEAICGAIITSFEARVPELYDPEDRERGYIDTRDRQDRPIRLPLMSISLAIINAQPQQYQSTEELARVAADLKKYAKSQKGSIYVIERRNKYVS